MKKRIRKLLKEIITSIVFFNIMLLFICILQYTINITSNLIENIIK